MLVVDCPGIAVIRNCFSQRCLRFRECGLEERKTVDSFAEAHDDLVRRDLSCFDGTHSPDDRGGDLFASLRGTTRFREPGNVNKRHAKQCRARALTKTCCNMRDVFSMNTVL